MSAMMQRHARNIVAIVLLWTTACAWAQEAQTQHGNTTIATSQQPGKAPAPIALDERDLIQAQIWGLDHDEMRRAKVLMQGPRQTFSVENISPIEVLGIHARNADERRKYAEKFAKALREDVERSLAWEREFQAAMQRLYPNSPVVDFSGMQPVEGSTAAADMLNIPRSLVIDRSETSIGTAVPRSAATRAIESLQGGEGKAK